MKTTWALLLAGTLLLTAPGAGLARSTRDHGPHQQNTQVEQHHDRGWVEQTGNREWRNQRHDRDRRGGQDYQHDRDRRGGQDYRHDRDHRRDRDHRWRHVNNNYWKHGKHGGHRGHDHRHHHHHQKYLYPYGGRLIIPLPPVSGFLLQLHW